MIYLSRNQDAQRNQQKLRSDKLQQEAPPFETIYEMTVEEGGEKQNGSKQPKDLCTSKKMFCCR